MIPAENPSPALNKRYRLPVGSSTEGGRISFGIFDA